MTHWNKLPTYLKCQVYDEAKNEKPSKLIIKKLIKKYIESFYEECNLKPCALCVQTKLLIIKQEESQTRASKSKQPSSPSESFSNNQSFSNLSENFPLSGLFYRFPSRSFRESFSQSESPHIQSFSNSFLNFTQSMSFSNHATFEIPALTSWISHLQN